jgi:hypothetical protein
MQNIINIKQIEQKDVGLVGEKAAFLGKLSNGFNVAPGYVLTNSIFNDFIKYNKFEDRIRHHFTVVEVENQENIENVANELQKLILSGDLSQEAKEGIVESYFSLDIKDNVALSEMVNNESEPLVVVRASPLTQSNTGDYLSLLHVKGKEKLFKSIIAIFASLFSVESIKNIMSQTKKKIEISVIIQKMIIPYISGNISHDSDDIIVKACYGLSDEKTLLDKFVLSNNLEIKTITVERQKTAYMQDVDTEKLAKIELTEIKADNQKINEKQAITLARLFKRTEFIDKKIEFIIDKENYYFTQVLNMEEKKESNQEKSNNENVTNNAQNESNTPQNQNVEQPKEQSSTSESTDSQPKGNTLFNLFSASRGDELPDIPSTPDRDPARPVQSAPVEQVEQPQAAPVADEPVQQTNEEEAPVEQVEQPQAASVVDEPVQQTNEEIAPVEQPQTMGDEPVVNQNMDDQVQTESQVPQSSVEEYDLSQNNQEPEVTDEVEEVESFIQTQESQEEVQNEEQKEDNFEENVEIMPDDETVSNEMTHKEVEEFMDDKAETFPETIEENEASEITQPSIQSEEVLSNEPQYDTNEEAIEENSEALQEPVSNEIKSNQTLHPLSGEEWLQTIRMEHTKMILSYDIVILTALKNKYTQFFNEVPTSFEELIDRIKSKSEVPYEAEIKKIRELRDNYLEHQKTISMQELKNSYETTVLFLREFS